MDKDKVMAVSKKPDTVSKKPDTEKPVPLSKLMR